MFMNSKNDRKLVVAANIIQIIIAASCIVIAFSSEWKTKDWSDILLGISTGLIGNVIIFMIMKYFMNSSDSVVINKIDEILKEQKISDDNMFRKVENMISAKMTELNYCIKEKDALTQFFSCVDLERTEEIYMIGYSMAHVFEQYRQDFIKYLEKCIKIKVILISPESTAGKLMAERVGIMHRVGEPHRRTLRYIDEINDESNNDACKIEVAKVSWVPSCTIILTKSRNEDYFVLLKGINGFSLNNKIRGVDRRLYSVSTSSFCDERITFFKNNFEYLWNDLATEQYKDIKEYMSNYEK